MRFTSHYPTVIYKSLQDIKGKTESRTIKSNSKCRIV